MYFLLSNSNVISIHFYSIPMSFQIDFNAIPIRIKFEKKRSFFELHKYFLFMTRFTYLINSELFANFRFLRSFLKLYLIVLSLCFFLLDDWNVDCLFHTHFVWYELVHLIRLVIIDMPITQTPILICCHH